MKRQRSADCRHFTGIQHGKCKAGIHYDEVRDESARPYRFACLGEGVVTCRKYSPKTPDEVEAEEREIQSRFADVLVARQAVVEHAAGRRGVAAELPCPLCKSGTLRYSIARVNGHVHARCSTADCVGWME
jgi:hypothetical protein